MKIDKRRKFIAVIDTETANTLEEPLVFDVGWAIVDKRGNVYVTRSYLVKEIYCQEPDLMASSYYVDRLSQYETSLNAGSHKILPLRYIRNVFIADCKRYHCNTVCAHNASFDLRALNVTRRYLTKSKYRYFFPYDFQIWDTMKMAQDVICPMPTYKRFCNTQKNGFTKSGQPRKTAEMLYRFISKNPDFCEAHTGLADVLIEKDILAYCIRQHKAMRKELFSKNHPKRKVPESEDDRIMRYITELWGA